MKKENRHKLSLITWKDNIKEIKKYPEILLEPINRHIYLSETIDENTITRQPTNGGGWITNDDIFYAVIGLYYDPRDNPKSYKLDILPYIHTHLETAIRGKDKMLGVLRERLIDDKLVDLIKTKGDSRVHEPALIGQKELVSIFYKLAFDTSGPFLE